MAISASTITASQTLEEFRLEFNKLQSDVNSLQTNATFVSTISFEGSTEDDFETSPLYIYVSLTWYIKGTKSRVLALNRHEVKVASKTIPNIGKLLPDYQYYRSNKKLGTVDEIRARLGILTDESTAGETTTTSTTTTTTTGTATTAPPAGGMAGGTGGTGGTGGGSY